VAPLAATLAATVALGVGVGLSRARSERERRRLREHELERRLGVLPGEPLGEALRRMALGQIDLALEQLGAGEAGASGFGATGNGAKGNGAPASNGASNAPDERAVHETRKAIKRVRALLRLLHDELGERACAREHATLRTIAQRLSGARDAAVMLATLEDLIERQPRKLGRRGGVRKLRARLHAEHERAREQALRDPAARAEVLGELQALRWRVSAWRLPERKGIALVDADLERVYRQGRERGRRLAHGKGVGGHKRVIAFHRWRKRVKDLRYAAEMLDCVRPDAPGRSDGELRRLARRADELAETLGEEHDLAIFAAHVRGAGKRDRGQTWHTGRGTRARLLRAVAKRRRALRKLALRRGKRLYGERPGRFMRGVRAAHSAGRRR
jgi:CHAD domain-containing protein